MATSVQLRHASFLLLLVVFFIGSADAWGCPDGYKGCDEHKPGCETCIKTDVNHCGDCYKKCEPLPYTTVKCYDGKCKYMCTPGWADCDNNLWKNGCETDIYNDAKNCGKCGYCCPVTIKYGEAYCSNGKCYEKCKNGWKYDQYKKCCVQY